MISTQEKTIRKAKVQDFLAISALDRDAWGTDPNDAFIPDGEHAWRLWVEYAYVLVAEVNGEVVGAILAFPTNTLHEPLFAVHKVFVDARHQGNKIGSDLFYELLDILDKENASSFLTVRPDNKPAIQLYNKMGYDTEKYVEGYYRPNEHRIVMVRKP